jgi:phage-related protein
MKLVYYKKRSGKVPVKDFINKLSKRSQVKVETCLKFLQEEETNAKNMVFRQIKGKLWEIKIRTSDGSYRIFYTMLGEDIMMLLHAYKKQSQKAPKKELDIAIKRMNEVKKEFNIK